MTESHSGSVRVLFQIALMILMNVRTGNSLDLFKSVTGEGQSIMGDIEKDIKLYNNISNTGIGFNFGESVELLNMNDTTGWSSKKGTTLEEISNVGKTMKGFFFNQKTGLLGGNRRKRSANVYDALYVDQNQNLRKIHMNGLRMYKKKRGMKLERQPWDTMVRWPAWHRWYKWPDFIREMNRFVSRKGWLKGPGTYAEQHPLSHHALKSIYYTTNLQSKPSFSSSRQLQRVQQSHNTKKDSLNILKDMKTKLAKKRYEEKQEKLGSDVLETMQISIGTNDQIRPESRYKCKIQTKGFLSYQDGRTIKSNGLTYSEDNQGVRTLLCKAETSETSEPNEDIFFKNSVTGLNVVTNDRNPFKFLERGNELDSETLNIGSRSSSELDYSSTKNQSMSSVITQAKGAHSQTKTKTNFVYENGDRKAFESVANVDGSLAFNSTDGQLPLILTSKKEEFSSILQNPENLELESVENDEVSTLMNYRKKVDFDIAFRNLFHVH